MKVLYFNNWLFTNVGEAFIDIGGMELTKRMFPNAQIACISGMSNYYIRMVKETFHERIRDIKKDFRNIKRKQEKAELPVGQMDDYLDADYVILPGMMATCGFLDAKERQMVDNLRARGCKLIFLGLGGFDYEGEEVYRFSNYLEETKPEFVVTRDIATYDNYKNVANCINGIDCAFWTKDVFNPAGFQNSIYDVVTFNRTEEPEIFSTWTNPVIRPYHMQFSYTKDEYRKDIMLSDTPYDYLTVYANANRVYTDLVHATIVSLMYGTPVKFWYVDKRSQAIYSLENLRTDSEKFMTINEADLEEQKEKVINAVKEHMSGQNM